MVLQPEQSSLLVLMGDCGANKTNIIQPVQFVTGPAAPRFGHSQSILSEPVALGINSNEAALYHKIDRKCPMEIVAVLSLYLSSLIVSVGFYFL